MSFAQRMRNAVSAFKQSPAKGVITTQSSQQAIWALKKRSDNLTPQTREEIKRNPYIYAALRNTSDELVGRWNGASGYAPGHRHEAGLSRSPQILSASDLSMHREQADHLRWNIDNRLRRGWDAVLRALLHAREDGKTVLEIVWKWQPAGRYAGTWVIDDLLHCDPDFFNFSYQKVETPAGVEVRKQLCYNPMGGIGGHPVPDGKFIVYSFDRSYENDEGNSILNKLNLFDWYQRNNFVFWMVDLNRYGSPLLVGKVPKGAKQEQRDALFNAINSVQQETGIVLSEDELLEILQAQRNGAPGFELLNRIVNAIISVVITGNALSLESTQQGSYALAKATTAEIREIIFRSLATEIDGVINHQLIYWWMTYNYPATQEYPKHQLLFPREEELSSVKGSQLLAVQSQDAVPVMFAEEASPEEVLVDAAVAESLVIFEQNWISPLLSALYANPEQALTVLDDFEPDQQDYIDLLARVMVTAHLLGRWQVRQEVFSSRMFADISDEDMDALLSRPILLDMAREIMLSKQLMSKADFERLVDQKRRLAFTISGKEDQRIQAMVRALIAEALADGVVDGFELERRARAAFAAYGIASRTSYHAETVFRTNIQSALHDARAQMLQDPEYRKQVAFFEYVTKDDPRVRPTHVKMHGIVRPPDDPVWQIWWPPNGYCCRCTIRIITHEEARRRNVQPSPLIPKVYPDKGFSSGPSAWIS